MASLGASNGAVHANDHPTGWRRRVYSTNHKDIGTMYIVLSVCAGLVGSLLSVAMRAELAEPGLRHFSNPQIFNVLVSAHGLVMFLIVLMSALIGRFVETYFGAFAGKYFTGDGCRRDGDGDCWITGRVDDVINVSGHRLGTAEIESALVAHPLVAEAAVVGYPHEIKGQGIYAFVTQTTAAEPSEALRKDLVREVRREIGPVASPDLIQWAPALPKTRSGKSMRRVLRKIAGNDFDSLGDTSTSADPDVIESLVANRPDQAAPQHPPSNGR